MENICINIYNLRNGLGMTQQQLADKCGYTDRTTIAKIEAGATDFNTARLQALADALQTTIGKLFGDPVEVDLPEEEETGWYELRTRMVGLRPHSIYKIENKTNGKVYIGNTISIGTRWEMHNFLLAHGQHTAKQMQADYDNGDEFVFEELESGLEKEIASEREMLYMVIYRSFDPKHGYNSQDPRFYSKSLGRHTKMYELLKEQLGVSE